MPYHFYWKQRLVQEIPYEKTRYNPAGTGIGSQCV
jgi:hypothetical protein